MIHLQYFCLGFCLSEVSGVCVCVHVHMHLCVCVGRLLAETNMLHCSDYLPPFSIWLPLALAIWRETERFERKCLLSAINITPCSFLTWFTNKIGRMESGNFVANVTFCFENRRVVNEVSGTGN